MKMDSTEYWRRANAINKINAEAGTLVAIKLFTSNVYYLNKQYSTGTTKLNKWLKDKGHDFRMNRVQLSYLHTGKRSNLNFMFIYIYTMYYNTVFNLKLQPYELITFNFELHGMYINPNRKKDLRYNKVKRIV